MSNGWATYDFGDQCVLNDTPGISQQVNKAIWKPVIVFERKPIRISNQEKVSVSDLLSP